MKDTTILKLNKIFKNGYLPSRDKNEKYNYIAFSGKNLAKITNCFEHACFNLTNEQLENFDLSDLKNFFSLPKLSNDELSQEDMFEVVKDAIASTGLKVKKMQEQPNNKSWNVAMYFSDYDIDLHFLLQEKDGTWSGKFGESDIVDHFNILPLKIIGTNVDYHLYKVFTIENPYIKDDNKNNELGS